MNNILDFAPLGNQLGFLALAAYAGTLAPTTMRIVFPKTKTSGIPKTLLQYRREVGILAFLFALGHGYLLVHKRHLDFLDPSTYVIYVQGVATFIIFTLLAITSNDRSVKRLKKNWKRLHSLTYAAMFLLCWHVIDKMAGHWSWLTPISLAIAMGITILYLVRKCIERRKEAAKAQKAKAKAAAVR